MPNVADDLFNANFLPLHGSTTDFRCTTKRL